MNLAARMTLDTASFVGPLQGVMGGLRSLLGMAGIAGGVAGAVAGLRSGLKMGSDLSDLKDRTGAAVGELVLLRQAFEDTGVGADAVPTAIQYMQKSLSGLSEEGKPTLQTFRRLNLDMKELAGLPVTDQLTRIGSAISGLGSEADKTEAAMTIFGRSGAALKQFFADPEAIEKARAGLGSLPQVLERDAAMLDDLDDALGRLKTNATGLFLGMASQLAPQLNSMLDKLRGIDMSRLGQQLAAILPMVRNIMGLSLASSGIQKALTASMGSAGSSMAQGFSSAMKVAGPLVGAAIAGEVIGGIIKARAEIKYGGIMGRTNDLATEAGDLKKQALGIRSIADWEKTRTRIAEAMSRTRGELAGPDGSNPLIAPSLKSHMDFLQAMYRGTNNTEARDRKIASNTAADALDRRRSYAALGTRIGAAQDQLTPPTSERRVDETDEEYDRRSLAAAQARLRAIGAEFEAIRKLYNAGKATSADAERAEALAKEHATAREEAVRLSLGLKDSVTQPDNAQIPPALSPQMDADRWAKVGLFVGSGGGPALDYNRRTATATEKLAALAVRTNEILNRLQPAAAATWANA